MGSQLPFAAPEGQSGAHPPEGRTMRPAPGAGRRLRPWAECALGGAIPRPASPLVQPPAVPRLILVQALRGLAALSIAMLHALHEAELLAGAAGLAFAAPARVPWAAGVDLFFVISGLIMVHASAGLFGRAGARRVFLARRIARIVDRKSTR